MRAGGLRMRPHNDMQSSYCSYPVPFSFMCARCPRVLSKCHSNTPHASSSRSSENPVPRHQPKHGTSNVVSRRRNLNREWVVPCADNSPEVFHARAQMDAIGVDFLADVHGDEELPYNFIAGGCFSLCCC